MKTIQEMAREAWAEAGEGWVADAWFDDRAKAFEAFAALVIANHPPQSFMTWQEGYEAGKQTEREACAKVCEAHWEIDGTHTAKEFAAAIRARGQA